MARSIQQFSAITGNDARTTFMGRFRAALSAFTAVRRPALPAALRQDAGEDDVGPISRPVSARRHEAEGRAFLEMLNRRI